MVNKYLITKMDSHIRCATSEKGSTKMFNNYQLIALYHKILLHLINERLKSYLLKETAT